MADALFIFRTSGAPANTAGQLAALALDCSMHETHAQEAQVTSHPVEDGANISDHSLPMPRTLQVDGMVTNTGPRAAYIPDRAKSVEEQLYRLLNEAIPCEILTELKQYENMLLKSIQIPRDSQTTESMRFTATFEQIITVKTQTVQLPKVTKGTNQPKKKLGKQATQAAPAPIQQSALAKIEDFFKAVK